MANMRTLEQKICDAGPGNQRFDPHILTKSKNMLMGEGEIAKYPHSSDDSWYCLPNVQIAIVRQRFQEQKSVHREFQKQNLNIRIGQCLEIAILKVLRQQDVLEFFGDFPNLDDHDDSTRYGKAAPPSSLSHHRLPNNQRFDFLVRSHGPEVGWAGIEDKNTRPWLYPGHDEVKALIRKAIQLNCVPVLIARRIQYTTFEYFRDLGDIVHQTYNQLLPESEQELAAKAPDKRLLGYHDIRAGCQTNQIHHNEPSKGAAGCQVPVRSAQEVVGK